MESPRDDRVGVFDGVRLLSGARVVAAVVVAALLSVAANFALFRSRALDGLVEATGGLVTPTLVASLVLLLVVVAILVGPGRARPFDLGLRRGTFFLAAAATLAAWGLLHGVAVLGAAVEGVPPRTSRPSAGALVAQVLGNALFEEFLFRGVLLVQIALRLRRRSPGRDARATWLALLASQALFALHHVPNRLASGAWSRPGTALADLGILFVAGVAFAAVFLRTGSLLLAVGFHALANAPALFLVGPDWTHPVGMGLVLLACVALGSRLAPSKNVPVR